MSSSSLTSVSINKNKNRFAPKVKARPAKRPQPNDASSSSSIPSLPTTREEDANTTKAGADINTDSDTIKGTLERVSTNTLPDITNFTDSTSMIDHVSESIHSSQKISQTSSTSSSSSTPSSRRRSSTLKRRTSTTTTTTTGTPIVPGASSSRRTSTPIVPGVSSSTTGTNTAKKHRNQPIVIPAPGTRMTPPLTTLQNDNDDDDDDSTTALHPLSPASRRRLKSGQISLKNMKNIREAMNKSSRPPPPKPTLGNSFAVPSNTLSSTLSSTSTSTSTVVLKKEEVDIEIDELDGVDSADDDDEINETTMRILAQAKRRANARLGKRTERPEKRKSEGKDRSSVKKRGRRKQEPIPAKDLKTLDDIEGDPLPAGNLDRSMAYYIHDRRDGIVTKQYRDEQTQLELQREEEQATKKNDKDTLDRLAQQKQAFQEKKELDNALVAKKAEEERRLKEEQQNQGGLTESSHSLQVRMVNGKIVLDTDSMQIDRQLDHEKISHDHMEVVEENAQSRKVNSRTYGKKFANARWKIEETDLFYELISQFGTDFEMISHMIPGRSRTQIRHKYAKEVNVNPKKVEEYMVHKRKPLDLESFKKATGLQFEKVPDNFHSIKLA